MRRYLGFSYPVQKTVKGFLHAGDDINQIKSDMLSVIMTRPGERIMEPRFGTALNRLNPWTNTPEIFLDEVRQMVATSLKIWEKRVQITDVQALIVPNADGMKDLNIQVLFMDPSDLQVIHQLTVQLPLEGL